MAGLAYSVEGEPLFVENADDGGGDATCSHGRAKAGVTAGAPDEEVLHQALCRDGTTVMAVTRVALPRTSVPTRRSAQSSMCAACARVCGRMRTCGRAGVYAYKRASLRPCVHGCVRVRACVRQCVHTCATSTLVSLHARLHTCIHARTDRPTHPQRQAYTRARAHAQMLQD